MKFVTADQPGKNIKLHPGCTDRIFTDVTDDGQDVVIVGGRVIRVDEPSNRMYEAITQMGYGQSPTRHSLLVETSDAPTAVAPVTVMPVGKTPDQLLGDLKSLAASLGFNLTPVNEQAPAPDQTAQDSGDSKAKK